MKRIKPFIAVAMLLIMIILSVPVNTQASAALKALQEAQAAQEAAAQEVKDSKEEKDVLEGEKAEQEGELAGYNNEFAKVTSELLDLDEQLNAKEAEITQIEQELEAARETEELQYESMKKRIKFIYEEGELDYFEMLLTANSYTDYLNKSDYIEKLAEYDRKMLDEYTATKVLIEEQEVKLNGEEAVLDKLRADSKEKQNKFDDLVQQSQNEVNMTASEVAVKEAQLLEEEKILKEKENSLAKAKEEYALSQAAANAAWRGVGDITFGPGDEFLMASIIYCEAGGESYEGQLAVGAVIMNRLLSSRYPDTLAGVIYQRKQFSPVLSGRLEFAMANKKATASCYKAARAAMEGQTNVDNCLYFRTPIAGISPRYTIGGHIFY